MSYALEGGDCTLSAAAVPLEVLYTAGNLRFADYETPVLICFDYQAAAMQMAGRDMEIIVPAEGTLCFEKGLPERLGDYVGDLLGDVRAEAEEEQDSLETLQHQFVAVGVTVELEGQLPERGRYNALCIDLVREGITNAVRHSLASRVLIRWTESEQSFIMSVSNSGFSSKRVTREGGASPSCSASWARWAAVSS